MNFSWLARLSFDRPKTLMPAASNSGSSALNSSFSLVQPEVSSRG